MKRFYKKAEAAEVDGNYTVFLDGKPIKTPAKEPLILSNQALAEEVAKEWEAQEDEVDPSSMPAMKYAATAIDRVTTQRDAVIEEICGFGGTDLVCYRAAYPEKLVEKQTEAWDPLVVWIKEKYQIELKVTTGVGYVAQEDAALEKFKSVVSEKSDLHLAALHDVVSLTGSLVVSLAVLNGEMDAERAFDISELDETHVMEEWGEDAEQIKRRKNNKASLISAVRFLELCDR